MLKFEKKNRHQKVNCHIFLMKTTCSEHSYDGLLGVATKLGIERMGSLNQILGESEKFLIFPKRPSFPEDRPATF